MKLYFQDLVKSRLEKGVVSFFNELDTRQRTMLITTLYDLPNNKLYFKNLDSFFNELDTRQGTML